MMLFTSLVYQLPCINCRIELLTSLCHVFFVFSW
jgi:hypothetical protein